MYLKNLPRDPEAMIGGHMWEGETARVEGEQMFTKQVPAGGTSLWLHKAQKEVHDQSPLLVQLGDLITNMKYTSHSAVSGQKTRV